jgi:hypothetical protein
MEIIGNQSTGEITINSFNGWNELFLKLFKGLHEVQNIFFTLPNFRDAVIIIAIKLITAQTMKAN